jgi:arylsulfatase A-like enzyme
VPAFLNWPGQLEPGSVDYPIHIADWLPTLCALTGQEHGLRPDLDGRNIWSMLKGERPFEGSRTMYWKIRGTYAVRDGDWKLLVNRNNNSVQLFDLENDFRESSDVSLANPEKVEHLMALLEEFKKGDRE